MKRYGWAIALCVALVMLLGCDIFTPEVVPTATPAITSTPTVTPIPHDSIGRSMIGLQTIIVKLVAFPSDRERDFKIIHLETEYTVYFKELTCVNDGQPFMYGPLNAVKHCEINQPHFADELIKDQAWLEDDIKPFQGYLGCLNGWIYLGADAQTGKQTWFIEMFGFPFGSC